MDSGDTGSMQSSSERDDHEFNSSRGESVSSFFNTAPPHPPFPPPENHSFFDPQFHHSNIINGGDLIWPVGSRSEAASASASASGFPYFENFIPPPPHQPSSCSLPSTAQLQSPPPQQNAIKNPKKRNRASRRAPTTVLTTDVNNFRQMVQEFTGIPASPFSGSPYSRRLDLFPAASFRPNLDALGLRPPLHKVLPQFPISSFPSPSAASRSMLNTPNIGITNNNTNTSNNSSSDHQNHHQHLMNLQNQSSNNNNLPLQLDFGNFSGFLNRENASIATTETAGLRLRRNDGDEGNLVDFDGNI